MIVADTNVWSEPLRPLPDEHALSWFAAHRRELLLTSITVGELLHGVARLPAGRRRSALADAIEAMLRASEGRILAYDEAAARAYAAVRARRTRAGRPIGAEDAMIAAICVAGGHDVATRNVSDFTDVDVRVIDPWSDR